jgi:hypothetical protein
MPAELEALKRCEWVSMQGTNSGLIEGVVQNCNPHVDLLLGLEQLK